MAVIGHVPTITNANYTNSVYDGAGTSVFHGLAQGGTSTIGLVPPSPNAAGNLGGHFNKRLKEDAFIEVLREVQAEKQQEKKVAKSIRRLVKVIIIDTDENVPLDKCVLYSGAEKLTDATDQELFFEIDIKNILDKHNEYRVTLKDKSVKERVENLEPVKIRDLRMVVVNVATF